MFGPEALRCHFAASAAEGVIPQFRALLILSIGMLAEKTRRAACCRLARRSPSPLRWS